jgi:hypothetical protein
MSITFLCLIILQTVIVTAVTLVITSQLAKRNQAILGVVLALCLIALVELILQWTVSAGIQDCLQRACASAGQPPDCHIAEFGCTEWSGLSRFIYMAVGVVDLAAYLIGGVIVLLAVRRRRNNPPPEEPTAVEDRV